MFWAAAMVAVFLILLGFLHCLGQVQYKFLCHTLNSIGVIALSTLFYVTAILFQVCHSYYRGLNRLGAFQLYKGKKLITLGLGWLSAIWACDGSITSPLPSQPPSLPRDHRNTSFHWCWLSGRPPLF